MRIDIFATTGPLPLAEARKLMRAVSKGAATFSFHEIACEGGAVIEEKQGGLSKEDLGKLVLPNSMRCLDISAECVELLDNSTVTGGIPDWLDSLFLGGAGRRIPHPIDDFGWESKTRVVLIPEKHTFPLSFSFATDNTLRYMGRKFDRCHSVEICFMPYWWDYFESSDRRVDPESASVGRAISEIWQEFGLPKDGDFGVYEEIIYPTLTSRVVQVDPDQTGWDWRDFKEMITALIRASSSDRIGLFSSVNPGFIKGSPKVADEAPDLISDIVSNAHYEKFDVTYNFTGTMAWKAREKIRKKLTEPFLQEVGRLEFKSGGDAVVKIVIKDDGYVFHLDFTDTKTVEAFSKTNLFKKNQWEIDR